MNYSAIKYNDIANGTGVRTVLFVSGCTHHCRECFQPQTWDFNYGKEFDEDVIQDILQSLEPDYVEGLTLLGGEPFEHKNQRGLISLLRAFGKRWGKAGGSDTKKNIWCYSGYTYERDILAVDGHARCECTDEMLSYIDILVDGEFEIENKSLMLNFRGSSNQRIIDVPASLRQGRTILSSLNN